MDQQAHYWFRQAHDWRKRARAAELRVEKLERRMASLDRAVSQHRNRARNTAKLWMLQIREAVRVRKCIEDAERLLIGWKPGMNTKLTQQKITDALAFLRVAHPSPDGGKND